jgi:hypothetical protein
MLFFIVSLGNMLLNTVGTHYEIKGIDGNTTGFFSEFGGNAKILKNENC